MRPGFLFLEEPAKEARRRTLTDYELASRLSYFLWSTMPDDALFAIAAAGKLHEPATFAAEVRRMLADAKSEQLVHNFAGAMAVGSRFRLGSTRRRVSGL